ncbi:hypothetical protein TanjilG_27167 [Lupinus angustifolius]|uniref:Uncharacterized protein n=1 Tax=Lupinus angustifolius TaxID=3871 RepID=A0A4P1QW58_LUPAN|nr:PREDICTED: uncharacterized protein LOC109329144 [Lupinus angustifolius]OIV96063.1 hypothetical protein TanjilG_27167 [Lupinus angustifolius]
MEGFPERTDLRTMQREQERERRRIRDRQRRQSMTQEQREMHLARRRRNYQLRRMRAANAHAPFVPFSHQHQLLESSAGEASTSDEFQGVTSSTSMDYSALCHGITQHDINQGLETLNLGTKVDEGSSSHLETLDHNLANSSGRLRLSHIRRLARNVTCPNNDLAGTHQVAAELITEEDVIAGDYGSTPKSLRLNRVKRVARSRNSPSEDSIGEKDRNLHPEEIHLLVRESFIASS